MKMDAGDSVQTVLPMAEGVDGHIAIFTEAGRAKRSPLDQHPSQKRGGKGVRMIIRRNNEPHSCIAMHLCQTRDLFELVDTAGNEVTFNAGGIPETRRDGNAWYIRELKLKDGAKLALVEHLVPPPAPEEESSEEASETTATAEAASETPVSDASPEVQESLPLNEPGEGD